MRSKRCSAQQTTQLLLNERWNPLLGFFDQQAVNVKCGLLCRLLIQQCKSEARLVDLSLTHQIISVKTRREVVLDLLIPKSELL